MSYRKELLRLLAQDASDKTKAEKYSRLLVKAKKSKFRQGYRKRLPGMPFAPRAIKKFDKDVIGHFIRRSLRKQAIARSRKVAKRDLFRDVLKKLEERAMKRKYSLLPSSVKLERAIEKEKFKKEVKKVRVARKEAFRRLTVKELRRSGLTEKEVQAELNRRSRAGEPVEGVIEEREFPGFAPPGFPGPAGPLVVPPPGALPGVPPIGPVEGPPGAPPGAPPGPRTPPRTPPRSEEMQIAEVEFELTQRLLGEFERLFENERETGDPTSRLEAQRRIQRTFPGLNLERIIGMAREAEEDEYEETREAVEILIEEGQITLEEQQILLDEGQPGLIVHMRETREISEQFKRFISPRLAPERRQTREELARVREESLQESLREISRQRSAEQLAGLERRDALSHLLQEERVSPTPIPRPSAPVQLPRETFPEPSAISHREIERALVVPTEIQLVEERIAEIARTPIIVSREEQEQAERLLSGISEPITIRELEALPERQLEQLVEHERRLREDIPVEETLEEELVRVRTERIRRQEMRRGIEAQIRETEKQLKKSRKKTGKGLVTPHDYTEADLKAFKKLQDNQVEIFRLEKDRRAIINSRPLESVENEALERSGRKPNKYITAIKRMKKAFPHISGKDALKVGGQESFGEGKPKKKVKSEASRKASLKNPWIIHLKKVMPGYKKLHPKISHKKIMGMVKASYKPKKKEKKAVKVKKAKKKSGGILPAQIVGSGKKKNKKSKKTSDWMAHLKYLQKKFPNLSYQQIMIVGKQTYKNPKKLKKMKKLLRGGDFFSIPS